MYFLRAVGTGFVWRTVVVMFCKVTASNIVHCHIQCPAYVKYICSVLSTVSHHFLIVAMKDFVNCMDFINPQFPHTWPSKYIPLKTQHCLAYHHLHSYTHLPAVTWLLCFNPTHTKMQYSSSCRYCNYNFFAMPFAVLWQQNQFNIVTFPATTPVAEPTRPRFTILIFLNYLFWLTVHSACGEVY